MKEQRLDTLLFPKDKGDDIAAKAGYPSIAVPGGFLSDGSPFGIMFTDRAFSEPTLLKLNYSFKQLRPSRVHRC
ncbi:MAG: putative amidase [Paenibacillus sp.]|nr:putative amidase [Paenibacillus sp.]